MRLSHVEKEGITCDDVYGEHHLGYSILYRIQSMMLILLTRSEIHQDASGQPLQLVGYLYRLERHRIAQLR